MSEPDRRRHREEEITVVRGGVDCIPELQPMWESLDEHHDAVAPELGRLRPAPPGGQSWVERRALYEKWLAEPDSFVLLAREGSQPVGYALVHMGRPEEIAASQDRVGELETLTLLPGYRGRGIGTTLMEAVYDELRRIGVTQISVSVIASNSQAVRFYERQGLMRFLVSYIGEVPGRSADQRPSDRT